MKTPAQIFASFIFRKRPIRTTKTKPPTEAVALRVENPLNPNGPLPILESGNGKGFKVPRPAMMIIALDVWGKILPTVTE